MTINSNVNAFAEFLATQFRTLTDAATLATSTSTEALATAEDAEDAAQLAIDTILSYVVESVTELQEVDPLVTSVVRMDRYGHSTYFKWEETSQVTRALFLGQDTATAINTATDEATFGADHDFMLGTPVYVTTGNVGCPDDTVMYVWRDPLDFTTLKFCPTYEDAMNATNFIELTDEAMFGIRIMRDPSQSMIVPALGEDLDGSAGAWVNTNAVGDVDPHMFGANDRISEDSSYAVQMALHWVYSSYDSDYTSNFNGRGVMYRCDYPINFTDVRRPGVMVRGLTIHSHATGLIAFDTTGCNTATFRDLIVVGDEDDTPKVGVYTGRAHTSTTQYPVPAASNLTFVTPRVYGYFTMAAFVNISSDLQNVTDPLFTNRYKSPNNRATTLIVAGTSRPLDQLGGLTSSFQKIIDSSDAAEDIGTVTSLNYRGVDVRRVRQFSLSPDDITVVGGVATLTFSAGTFAANDITSGESIHITAIPSAFNMTAGDYTLLNIDDVAGTAELGTASGASTYDASGISGTYTTVRVTDRTGPMIHVGGHMSGVRIQGYGLSYSGVSFDIDLHDGDLNNCTFDMHLESGNTYNFYVSTHATEDRKVSMCTFKLNGDLVTAGHFHKLSGGDVYFQSSSLHIAHLQEGSSLYPASRLFSGSRTQLHLVDVDVIHPSTFQGNLSENTAYANEPTGRVVDLESGLTVSLPSGQFTPTSSDTSNITGISFPSEWKYQQTGRVIEVWGSMNINPTISNTLTETKLTLPFDIELSADDQAIGIGVGSTSNAARPQVLGDSANNLVYVSYVPTSSGLQTITVNYKIFLE